jgi:hypothetical protein
MAGMRVLEHRAALVGSCFVMLLVACGGGEAGLAVDAGLSDVSPDSGAGGLGATCDILIDAGTTQAFFNTESLDCPSRICMKPSIKPGATGPSDTTAVCSAPCEQDSDCVGQTRDFSNPLDTRCQSGFTCTIQFVKGKLCCKRFCTCKDFLGPNAPQTPVACQGEAAATCNQP